MGDIKLNDGPDGQAVSWLAIETHILNVQGSDLILDSPDLLMRNYWQSCITLTPATDHYPGYAQALDDGHGGIRQMLVARRQFKTLGGSLLLVQRRLERSSNTKEAAS